MIQKKPPKANNLVLHIAAHRPRVGIRSAGRENEGATHGEGEREKAHEAIVQMSHAHRVAERLADHEHSPLYAWRVRGKDALLEGRKAVHDREKSLARPVWLGHTAGLAEGALRASEDRWELRLRRHMASAHIRHMPAGRELRQLLRHDSAGGGTLRTNAHASLKISEKTHTYPERAVSR